MTNSVQQAVHSNNTASARSSIDNNQLLVDQNSKITGPHHSMGQTPSTDYLNGVSHIETQNGNLNSNALDTHVMTGPIAWRNASGCNTGAIKILGDGRCGWRASWSAILVKSNSEKMATALNAFGVDRDIIDRVCSAMEVGKEQPGHLFTFGSQRPIKRPELSTLESSTRVKYPHELAYTEGSTQAEQDLQIIQDAILPKCAIGRQRLIELQQGFHADTTELQQFAKALQQELVIMGQGQIECLYEPDSALHQFVKLSQNQENPSQKQPIHTIGSLDHITHFYPVVVHDGAEHFNFQPSQAMKNQLEVFLFDFPREAGEGDAVKTEFLKEPVWTLYQPSSTNTTNKSTDFAKNVEVNHTPISFANGERHGEAFLLATWLQILVNAKPDELTSVIHAHCGTNAFEYLENLLPLQAAAKSDPASILAKIDGEKNFHIVSPNLSDNIQLNCTNRTPVEELLLKLTEQLQSTPKVKNYYRGLLAHDDGHSFSASRQNSNIKNVGQGSFHTTLQARFDAEDKLESTAEVRLTDVKSDANKALALSSALAQAFNSPVCVDYTTNASLASDHADGVGGNHSTNGLLLSAHGNEEAYFDSLCEPFSHQRFSLENRSHNHMSLPLIQSYLQDKPVLQKQNAVNKVWLPNTTWNEASVRTLNPISHTLDQYKDSFLAMHIGHELKRLQAEQPSLHDFKAKARNQTDFLKASFRAIMQYSDLIHDLAEKGCTADNMPSIDKLFEYYDVDTTLMPHFQQVKALLEDVQNYCFNAPLLLEGDLETTKAAFQSKLQQIALQKQTLLNPDFTSEVGVDAFFEKVDQQVNIRISALRDLLLLERTVNAEQWFQSSLSSNSEKSFAFTSGWEAFPATLQYLLQSESRLQYFINEEPSYDEEPVHLIDEQRAERLGIQQVKSLNDLVPEELRIASTQVDHSSEATTSSTSSTSSGASIRSSSSDSSRSSTDVMVSHRDSIDGQQEERLPLIASASSSSNFGQRVKNSLGGLNRKARNLSQFIKENIREAPRQNSPTRTGRVRSNKVAINPVFEKTKTNIITELRDRITSLVNTLLEFLSPSSQQQKQFSQKDQTLYNYLESKINQTYLESSFAEPAFVSLTPTGLPGVFLDPVGNYAIEVAGGQFIQRTKDEAILHFQLDLLSTDLSLAGGRTRRMTEVMDELQQL